MKKRGVVWNLEEKSLSTLLLEMPKQEDDLGVSDLRIGAGSGIGER